MRNIKRERSVGGRTVFCELHAWLKRFWKDLVYFSPLWHNLQWISQQTPKKSLFLRTKSISYGHPVRVDYGVLLSFYHFTICTLEDNSPIILTQITSYYLSREFKPFHSILLVLKLDTFGWHYHLDLSTANCFIRRQATIVLHHKPSLGSTRTALRQ
jgi:hypothetical protein